MKVTDQQLEKLAPYLAGSKPDARGEAEMFCPNHADSRRSASINLQMGVWYCHAGCGGGSVRQLVDASDAWVPMDGRADLSIGLKDRALDAVNTALHRPEVLKERAKEWHQRLMEEPGQRKRLHSLRGINRTTIREHGIGYDGRYFKLPVLSPTREVWNVRTYDPSPRFGRRKIWGERGMNRARLYPSWVLDWAEDGDCVLFCEGEWDTLLALQAGHMAVTTTSGAGKPWHESWNVAFAGLRVYLCADADKLGQKQNQIVGRALTGIAREVFECRLPFPIVEDHGKDITDLLINEEYPGETLRRLKVKANKFQKREIE